MTVRPSEPWPPDLVDALPGLSDLVRYFEQVESTNDLALSLAGAGAPTGTAVVADVQTAGRGRMGRDWWSPPGAGMYLSVVVRTAALGATTPVVTLAAGVALVEAISEVAALPVELKWPNDLVIGRPWRKLAGILCEGVSVGGANGAVVIGMGVNLQRSAYPAGIADRATSIAEECSGVVSRGALVAATLGALERMTRRLERGDVTGVLDAWRSAGRVALDHAPVRWRDQHGEHRGTTVGLDDTGALRVRPFGGGPSVAVMSGEVVWEMLTRD